MRRIILILSCFFGALSSFCQEDSTVYLKPSFQVGDQFNYKFKYSLVEEVNGQGNFLTDNYTLHLDLLKTAYGLGIFKMTYNSTGNDFVPGGKTKLKDNVKVFFTIDSTTRFVAVENCAELLDTLNRRSIDNLNLNSDSIDCIQFYPEVESIFMLNGAKYVKGEKYHGKTLVPTKIGVFKCNIYVEMVAFDRKENQFQIECQIRPQNVPDNLKRFKYTMSYTYRLSDLILLEMDSKLIYLTDEISMQKTMTLRSN